MSRPWICHCGYEAYKYNDSFAFKLCPIHLGTHNTLIVAQTVPSQDYSPEQVKELNKKHEQAIVDQVKARIRGD